jgi:predicted transcriptional regulator
MEPLVIAATAIATTIITKAFEKTGEKLGEQVVEQSGKLLVSLRHKSPNTAKAIELAPEQPLDYGQAVLEVDALTKTDPEIARDVEILAELASQESNPRLKQAIQEIINTLKFQQPTIQVLGKLAEKIGLVFQSGGTVSIHNFHMD